MRISDWSSDVCSSDLQRERIATIGRTMGTEHHAARRLFGREARAEREAAADPLRARHDVGCQAILLMGIEGAGARDAALDFVEDQHQVALVADIAQRLQAEIGRASWRERVCQYV